jgi:hypothetical protein
MNDYYKVKVEVAPKERALEEATRELEAISSAYNKVEAELNEV